MDETNGHNGDDTLTETAAPGETAATPMEPAEPAKPPMEAPREPPAAPVAAPRNLLRLSARQFVQARGIRWERAAGFLSWAGREFGDRHRLTTTDWLPVWDRYMAAPAGKPKR